METEFKRIQEQIDRQNKIIEAFQNENRWLKRILFPLGVLSLLSIGSFLWSSDITVPHTFSSGTLIQASSINSNFSTIYSHSNQHLRITSLTFNRSRRPLDQLFLLCSMKTNSKPKLGIQARLVVAAASGLCRWEGTSGSAYSTVTSQPNSPDLRGMFLRGLNAGRSDGKQDPEGGSRFDHWKLSG